MVAILAGKNGDVEASIDKLLKNGRAEVASGLGKIQGSAFQKGCGMKNEMDKFDRWSSQDCSLTPAKATLVMLLIPGCCWISVFQ